MRIALLGPYPVSGEMAGGVDAVVAALAHGLARRAGIDLHVIVALPERPDAVISRDGFTLHIVTHPYRDRLLWRQPVVRRLRHVLANIRPDVAHAHMANIYADAMLQWGGASVATLHGVGFREAALALAHSRLPARLRWQFDTLYERWVIRRARDLIAISPYMAQEYRPLTPARFHAIENPVADLFFDVSDAGTDALDAGGRPRLLCVARVIPRKDILTLIELFARIRHACPAAELEIAGQDSADPAYTAACRAAITRLGLDDGVRFLGSLSGSDLAACYARADLCLLTARQETAPVVIAEAMAAGRPVVATAVGGVPFMVAEGETGLLAAPGDVQGLADAAIALLQDHARRLAFGRAGRRAAERRFRLAVVLQRTTELYQALADRNLDDSSR